MTTDREKLIKKMELYASAAYDLHKGEPFCGRAMVNAALTAIDDYGAEVVPKVATEEMISEANTCLPMTFGDVWHAMIKASPFRSEG